MSEITLPKSQLISLLEDAAELGAKRALAGAGLVKQYVSKNEAYRMFGRGPVDRLTTEGLIVWEKDGNHSSKKRFPMVKLEAIFKASNRPSYMMVTERRAS